MSCFNFDPRLSLLSGENRETIGPMGRCQQLQVQNKSATAGVHVELLFTFTAPKPFIETFYVNLSSLFIYAYF